MKTNLYLILAAFFTITTAQAAIEIESLECTVMNPLGVSYLKYDPVARTIEQTTYSSFGYSNSDFKLLYVDNKLDVFGAKMVRVDLSTEDGASYMLLLNGRLRENDSKTLYGTFGYVLVGNVFMGVANYLPKATAQCRFLTR